jgi:hypothetical protein
MNGTNARAKVLMFADVSCEEDVESGAVGQGLYDLPRSLAPSWQFESVNDGNSRGDTAIRDSALHIRRERHNRVALVADEGVNYANPAKKGTECLSSANAYGFRIDIKHVVGKF